MIGFKLPFWRVQLGNLFYMGELAKDTALPVSYELTTEVEAANLFPVKQEAQAIADHVGGSVSYVELSTQEYSELAQLRNTHTVPNVYAKIV